jgi:hypothetical protein
MIKLLWPRASHPDVMCALPQGSHRASYQLGIGSGLCDFGHSTTNCSLGYSKKILFFFGLDQKSKKH